MSEYDLHKAKKKITYKLKEVARKKKLVLYKKIGIAASFALLIGLGGLVLNQKTKKEDNITITNHIKTGSSKAILTLENGNQVSLQQGKEYQNNKVKSNGKELLYSTTPKSKTIAYNYLEIPRGGKFFVQLGDSTKIWLNSESKIKYPTQFIDGKTRLVEVLYGEAYFEVSSSTKNGGSNFKVLTEQQEIDVLGTEFNVKAYNNDTEIATTLVNGSVAIKNGKQKNILKPNQQAIVNREDNSIKIATVDPSEVISWINGKFTFNEDSLGEMMQVLSRWYDVEVIFETVTQKDYVFTGILERTKSIEDILSLIEATSEGEIKFEINQNIIIIK